ncbi:response regulator receiver protein [Leptolyngbya sp. Heron Island J]|uniref:response regulator n=1 Tax=Leptolyngbya sp. Heron Island J TaxID=1385935 RepID=UPI0003B95BD9|nr:response regulator [Leptolyngbya sp. Heron Island J]ESA36268.1 response regulator receiver protein [Leptolyngbya sp. Heron Island J]
MTESVLNVLPLEHEFSVATLTKNIKAIIQTQTNGYIHLKTITGEQWWLDFRVGRLLWAGGGQHRFRRWQRLLRTHCPDLPPDEVRLRESEVFDHWEYVALSVLVRRQQMTREIAIAIIQATLTEVLFDICQAVSNITQIAHSMDHQARLSEPMAILSSTALFYRVRTELQSWQNAELNEASPNLAPVIMDAERLKQCTQPRTYQILKRLLHGTRSLRELSQITGHEVSSLGCMISAYVDRGMVILHRIDDLPNPYATPAPKAPLKAAQKLPLIFCIDDSPQVGYLIEEALRPAGYRCISIQDSIQALAQIIRHKPSLIFLDLVMPVANGYEICKQIRRVKTFRKTPIVILTGNDGIVDRMRAKAVGATDFMPKPVDPVKVIEMVRYQLANAEKTNEENLR